MTEISGSNNDSIPATDPIASKPENKQQPITVTVNTEKTSTFIFLLCFFLPFLAPIIALFKWQIGFLLVILLLWFLGFIFLLIPFVGWIAILIIDIVIAIKVAKMTSKTEVVVTPNT